MNIILASSSKYRSQILAKLGLEFSCLTPDCDESPHVGESAQDLVMRLATAKAMACAPKAMAPSLIIGSDQVCVLDGQIIGKPHTQENAIKQLTQASGKVISFYTGLCVYHSQSEQAKVLCNEFKVHFKKLTHAQIESYVAKEMPLDCAGSFKSEGLGIALFEKLEGDDPNALIGLPLIDLIKLLNQFGVEVL